MKKYHCIITICITLFIVLCILYILQCFAALSPTDDHSKVSRDTVSQFYDQKKDSLDAVYIGASSVTRYWIPAYAFNNTGITVSSLATTTQPFILTKYLLNEAKKSQDDALFIIEFRCIYKDASHVNETNVRRITDNIKPSLNRLKAVDSGIEHITDGGNIIAGSTAAVYFPALEYIKRFINDKLNDTSDYKNHESNNGFIISGSTFTQNAVPESKYDPFSKEDLDPRNEDTLNDLIDYCDSIDNDILFVLAPYSAGKNSYPKVNSAINIIESRGYKVLNMNTPQMISEIGIDWSTDFYNEKHVNILGAEKYTSFLADYLVTKYDMADHRYDPDYKNWHESYNLYIHHTKSQKSKMHTNR